MPDPFRHYEGAPLLDLPADPADPKIPALEVLQDASGATAAPDGAAFLSELLFHSAAVSASKQVPSTGYKYALRVNPSSGNLHPTEFHFLTRGLKGWADGLYHYRPSSHMAEQRATGGIDLKLPGDPAPLTFVLTSIAWREAWKYRDRAYRYCLHDIGHAWQSLALAAQAMGCETSAIGHFPDDAVARACRFHADEWPMLIVKVSGGSIPVSDPGTGARTGTAVWTEGRANRIAKHPGTFSWIDDIHAASSLANGQDARTPSAVKPDVEPSEAAVLLRMPTASLSTRHFGEVARMRRSALDFRGGTESISFGQLASILTSATMPLAADFADLSFIHLYLYVHRVRGLESGVYRYWPRRGELERIRAGDQRVASAGLSLGQDLAGNACVAFSMVADLDRATERHGDRGYRYAYFEAGAIGQRLYLAAEALGLGATGIGAFFDDQVHVYLGLTSGQAVYHFAIGHPAPDTRVAAE